MLSIRVGHPPNEYSCGLSRYFGACDSPASLPEFGRPANCKPGSVRGGRLLGRCFDMWNAGKIHEATDRPARCAASHAYVKGSGSTRFERSRQACPTIPGMLRRIGVFCGSSIGTDPTHRQAAQAVGRLLGQRGIELVYGGGHVGLMGGVADACLGGGGRVIGVIPQALADREVAHSGLSELHIVGSMHERKAMMAELSDAFIALPGGYGTWDELFEALTWSQLGIQRKACGVLNVNGYYDPLIAMADRALADGFIRGVHRDLLLADTDAARLLDRLNRSIMPDVDKWSDNPTR